MPVFFRTWHSMLRNWWRELNTTEDWRSWRLSWWWMSLIVALEVGFIVTIAWLTYLSHKHDGFMTVQYVPLTTISDLTWAGIGRTQIWWTLVPAIIFSLLGIGYATTVAGTAERQPFVELHNAEESASNAQSTILLDYAAYALFYAWAMAWKNAHIRLSCSMFVQLLVSVFLVSLASNLLRVEAVSHASDITLESVLEFNISTLDRTTDLLAAMDVASALHEYDAIPPGWMNGYAAVEPFSAVGESRIGNISTTTAVYSAKLDCRAIARSDINITYDGTDASFLGQELISFTDRGCNVQNQGFSVNADLLYYAVSWNQECAYVSNMWDDRIGVFMGIYAADDPQKMTDFITVSCIPSYQNTSTTVSINPASGQIISTESADADQIQDMHQLNFRTLHSNIDLIQLIDNTFVSDAFGRKVYRYAQELSGGGPIEAAYAINATQVFYSTFFAALAQKQLFRPRATPRTMPGRLSSTQWRLKVVAPIAYILIGLLTLMVVCSVALFVLACTSVSILQEEPVGLLGKAVLLMQSDIYPFISAVTTDHSDKRVVKFVQKSYSVKTSRCFMDDERIIRLSNLVEERPQDRRKSKSSSSRWSIKLFPRKQRVTAPNGKGLNRSTSVQESEIALSAVEVRDD